MTEHTVTLHENALEFMPDYALIAECRRHLDEIERIQRGLYALTGVAETDDPATRALAALREAIARLEDKH